MKPRRKAAVAILAQVTSFTPLDLDVLADEVMAASERLMRRSAVPDAQSAATLERSQREALRSVRTVVGAIDVPRFPRRVSHIFNRAHAALSNTSGR